MASREKSPKLPRRFDFKSAALKKLNEPRRKPKPMRSKVTDNPKSANLLPRAFVPPPEAKVEALNVRADLLVKRRVVLSRARCGDTMEEIARDLDITPKLAFDLLRSAMDEFAPKLTRYTEQVKEMELQRLEELESRLWKELQPDVVLVANERGDGFRELRVTKENSHEFAIAPGLKTKLPLQVHVARLILNVQKRRANLLGLDAAKKMEVDTRTVERVYVGVDPGAV